MPISNTIQVQASTELAAVVDDILRADTARVFLVIPDNARIARHILNFKLLRREAEISNKDVVIVSSHPRIQGLATKAGLKVHQLTKEFTVSAAQEKSGNRARVPRKHVADIVTSPHAVRRTRDQEDEIQETREAKERKTETLIRNIFHKPALRSGKKKKVIQEEVVEEEVIEEKENVQKKNILYAGEKVTVEKQPPSYWEPKERKIFSRKLLIGGVSAVVFGAIIFAFVVILPSVKVVVTPRTFDIEETIPITVSANVADLDLGKRLLPGQIVEDMQNHSQRFVSTGREDIKQQATGDIRVFNEFSSAPQTLVETTRFVSQDGYLFRTTRTVVIPGAKIEGGKIIASSTLVNVIADSAGKEYNISSSTFSIPGFRGTPKFTAFYGKSENSMEGGFEGIASVVTQGDIADAKELLEGVVTGRAADKLRANIPSGYFLAPGALEEDLPIITLDTDAGVRGESFTGDIRVDARAVLFRSEDITAVIDDYLEDIYRSDGETVLLPDLDISYEFQEKDYKTGEFTINLVVKQRAGIKIDVEDLRGLLVGKREGEARTLISRYQGIERANIRFWPFWVSTVPTKLDKITILLEY